MHICQILGGNEEGGLENHVISLCNHYSQQHQVSLIAHEKYRDRVDAKVNFIALPMDKSRRNLWLLWQLQRRLKQLKPTLIHAHGNKATAMLASIKRWLITPCIATLHSLKKKLWMFEKMDAVIGVSKGVLQPLKHPQQQAIYNGVTPYQGECYDKESLMTEWQLSAGQPLCVAIGRLVPVKAYDLLIKAWTNQQAALVIIGEGDEHAKLQQLIDQHQLNERIKLIGQRNDVAKILPAADLLAISSEREGFSLVMVESLLAGTAIVSTKVPGCREILPPQYLAECGNEAALAAALDNALQQPEQLAQAYQPVFALAQQQLTTKAMLAKTFAAYQQLLTMEACHE